MGLDKWLQSDKDEKKEIEQLKAVSSKKDAPKPNKKKLEGSMKQLSKFILICTNSKCKYQKVLMKRLLVDKDRICPRCKKKMKVKAE